MTRHFLDLSDFSGSELRAILRTGEEIKARRRTPAAAGDRLLEGKVIEEAKKFMDIKNDEE